MSTVSPISNAPQEHSHGQVQVKFITRSPDIAIPETGPILLPANLQRLGLSRVINHLLENETAIPFDFLVDGSFLRSSLSEYLSANGLSTESTLDLEYVRASVPPKFLTSFQHDDWVSSVSVAGDTILSGSYDGIVRIWNLSGQVLAEGNGHSAAIKSAAWLGNSTFATAGMDRSARTWAYDAETETVDAKAELIGHKSAIESLDTHAESQRILTASVDKTVRLWSADPEASPPAPAPPALPKLKKRKVVKENIARCGSLITFEGASQTVSGVKFNPNDPSTAYSVSWDHRIRTLDLTTGSMIDDKPSQHPLLSLTILPKQGANGVLICGSSARHILLHDPRDSVIETRIFRGHQNAVVALSPSCEDDFQFASAGHDGTVRVWDVRANAPLFTVEKEGGGKEKVFDVEWNKIGIVSGGEDKKVTVNATPREGEKARM